MFVIIVLCLSLSCMILFLSFLAHSSAHAPSVHLSWPCAYVKHLWKCSSSIELFYRVKQEFLDRLRLSFVSSEFVLYVDSITHYHARCNLQLSGNLQNTLESNVGPIRLWLPVAYHPLLYENGGLRTVLARINHDSFLCELLRTIFGEPMPSVHVAWKATARPFLRTLIEW